MMKDRHSCILNATFLPKAIIVKETSFLCQFGLMAKFKSSVLAHRENSMTKKTKC